MNDGDSHSGEISESDRLEGWKQIAGYLRCSKRTAQRWETLGLPVYRHGALGAVHAFKSELDVWLKTYPLQKQDHASVEAEAGPEKSISTTGELGHKNIRWRLPVLVFCAVATVLAAIVLIQYVQKPNETRRQRLRRSLAVIGFRNLTGRPEAAWLSTALSEMFRTELAAGEKLRPVSGEDISWMKRELAMADADSFSKETLARVRKNLGPDVVLLGSYVSLGKEAGGQIRLNLVLQDTRTGEVIASLSETGTESTLFQLVSHAGTMLRGRLGLGELSASQIVSLNTALPRNLEVQRWYAEGLEKARLFEATAARDALERVVQAEPNYALGHSALADAWSALGYEAKAKEEAKMAFDLSATLSPEEGLSIEAKYRELAREWDRAIEIYRQLCQFSADNLEYRLRLTTALTAAGKGEQALMTLAAIRKLPLPLREDPRIDLADALTAESLGDFKREQAAAALAAKKGESRGARLLVARATLRECWAFYNLGQPTKAIAAAETARKTFASVGDRGGEAQALKNIADVVDDQGDHTRAQKLYDQALAIFEGLGLATGVAVTLNNLGYALKSQGNLAGAKRMFEESLAVSRKIADQGREAQALNGITIILWRQGNLTAARQTYEEALRINRARNDKSRAATVLNNIAIVLEDQGYLADANQKFRDSLDMSRQIGDQSAVARALGNIGELLVKRGDLAGAKKIFEEQLSIGRTIPENKQCAYALYGLGEVLIAQDDLRGARTKHQEALALRMKMGEKGLVAESRLALAELDLEDSQPGAAETAAQQAVAEFRMEKELDEEALGYAVLARSLLAQSRTQEAQAAIQKANGRVENTQDRAVRLAIAIDAARVTAATGRQDEAMNAIRTAWASAAKYGYIGLKLSAGLSLAELELHSGKPTAFGHLAELEREAKTKGFLLIARKAASDRRKAKGDR